MSRAISTALAAHLAGAATTTCHLLKITPVTPGVAAFGITSGRIDLTYDDGTGALTYYAATGYTAFDLAAKPDLSIDTNTAHSLLSAYPLQGVTAAGIAAGDYDGAAFVQYLVNYQDLTMGHVILNSGYVGQVNQTDEISCQIELRSLSQVLKQNNIIELTSITCRAQFGDARCKMPLRFYASTVAAQSYASVVLADGPLLFYLLNETSGTTATNLGSFASADLTFLGGYTQGAATGRTGVPAGVSLDGTTGYLKSAAALAIQVAGTPYFTLEAWVLPTSISATFRISDSGNRLSMQATSDGAVQGIVWGGAGLSAPSGTLTAAQSAAKHLVYAYGDAGEAWYVDGALVASNAASHSESINNTAYFIGQYSAGGYFFNGVVAGHALYNYALSAAQVAAHYAAGAGTSPIVSPEPDRVFTFADIPGTSSAPGSGTGTVSVNSFFTGNGTTTVAQLLDTAGDVVTSGFTVSQIYRDGTLLVSGTDYTVSSTGLVSWIHGGTPYAPISGSVASWNGTIPVWPDGFFAPGVVHWTSGANAGRECDVESYASSTGALTLAIPAGQDIAIGDAFTIRRDCPKSKTACIAYGNLPNMRAEPELPRANGLDLQAPSSIG